MDMICNASGVKLLDLCKGTDLRIVNGRVGEDAGVGQFTFMSPRGNSVIDYVLMAINLFPLISEFVAHDLYSCSPHVPIQVNLKVTYSAKFFINDSIKINKLIWNNDRVDEYKSLLINEAGSLNLIVDRVLSSECDISTGIENFGDVLYNTAYKVFGESPRLTQMNDKPVRKYKSPWFTHECELARQQLKSANRACKKYKTSYLRAVVIDKRRAYCKTKRSAKIIYKNKQRQFFTDTAKKQPQKFWDEIRKLMGKKKCTTDIKPEDFFEHFKNLYSDEDSFRDDDVEHYLSQQDSSNIHIEQLDCNITIDEVKNAIENLKRKKSPGIDMLLPEIFIEGNDTLSPYLCKLFNYMYDNSVYPDCWVKGILVPVPKKGDKKDVNNYPGINLSSIFSKLFSQILDTRLRKWAEDNNNLTDFQFGFRQQKSTTDCIFILHSIINRVINKERKKVYCAFIDFKKAFDLVYRNGIWFKLLTTGVSSKFVKILQSMYMSVKTCVKVNGSLTQYFDSYMGVKQGEPLSPLLFILFINDMSSSLYDDSIEVISLNELLYEHQGTIFH